MFPQRAGEVGARRLVVSNGAEVKPDAPVRTQREEVGERLTSPLQDGRARPTLSLHSSARK
jgi:hypothetical protein